MIREFQVNIPEGGVNECVTVITDKEYLNGETAVT